MKNDKLVTFIVTYISKEIFSKVSKVFFALILIQFFYDCYQGLIQIFTSDPQIVHDGTDQWIKLSVKDKKDYFGGIVGLLPQNGSFSEKFAYVSYTARKMSKYGVSSGPYLPIFSPNTETHGPKRTTYLDTFHAVFLTLKAL